MPLNDIIVQIKSTNVKSTNAGVLPKSLQYKVFVRNQLVRFRRLGFDIAYCYVTREGEAIIQEKTARLPAGYTTSLLDKTGTEVLASLADWGNSETFQQRLDEGHQCFVLSFQGRPVGYTWARMDTVDELGCQYRLQPGEAFLYGMFICDSQRGKALASQLRANVYEMLRNEGITNFISTTEVFNNPAVKFKVRLGGRHIEKYLGITFRGKLVLQLKLCVK